MGSYIVTVSVERVIESTPLGAHVTDGHPIFVSASRVDAGATGADALVELDRPMRSLNAALDAIRVCEEGRWSW